jgi:hypothetical protein
VQVSTYAAVQIPQVQTIASSFSIGVTRAPPQRPLDNLRAWHPGPDPRTTSGFDGPPAYSDITAGRELPTRPIRRNRSGTRSLNAVLPIRPSIANSLPSENCQLTRQPGFSGLERTQSMPIRPARVNTPSNGVFVLLTIRYGNGDIEQTILDSTFSSEMAVIPENQVESVDRSPPAQITSGVLGLHRSHSWAPTWMSESQRSLQVGARAEDSESIRSGSQTESSSTPSTKLGQYPRSVLLTIANRKGKCRFTCRRPPFRICRKPETRSYRRVPSQCSSPQFTVSSGSSEAGDSGHGAHGDRLAQSSSCPRR